MMLRPIRPALVALLLLGGACGDDGPASGPLTSQAPLDDTTEEVDEGAANDTACPPQGFVGEISREADGDHIAGAFGTADVVTDLVVAARIEEGAFYSVYVSDHEYVGDPRRFETVEAAPGGVVATLSFRLESGFVKGEPFSDGDDGGFVFAIIDSAGGASVTTMNATGTATPIDWSDDWVCFEIDYADDAQMVAGTVSAPIVGGF